VIFGALCDYNMSGSNDNYENILCCVMNSNILRKSLEYVPEKEYVETVKLEFEKMCERFNLDHYNMISLVIFKDQSLLTTHYTSIWEGLNFYSMTCMDEYRNAHVRSIDVLTDPRLNTLCDDLQRYIKLGVCINSQNGKCDTLEKAFKRQHEECVVQFVETTNKLRWMMMNQDYDDHHRIIEIMCENGFSLNMIKYMIDNINKINNRRASLYITSRSFKYASKNGQLDVVKYLFGIRDNVSLDTVEIACEYGHCDIVKYLSETCGVSCTNNVLKSACKNNYYDIVKYLYEVQQKYCSKCGLVIACENGSMDVVKYFFEEMSDECYGNSLNKTCVDKRCDNYYADQACVHGQFDVVKYLFEEQQKKCSKFIIDPTFKRGHYDCIKYVFETQHESCTYESMQHAIRIGCFDMVVYLFEVQKIDCTNNDVDIACENGYFDIVKYLFETQKKNCTKKGIDLACENCHLDVVVYLFEIQHKSCSPNVINTVCIKGHIDIVKYLLEKQQKTISLETITPEIITTTCINKHHHIIKYLFEEQNMTIHDDAQLILKNQVGRTKQQLLFTRSENVSEHTPEYIPNKINHKNKKHNKK